jgi:hypothetical protein
MFRQLSTTQGRWVVPDPAGLAAGDITDPQSWNRFTYVRNSSLAFTDPIGLSGHRECHGPPDDQTCEWVSDPPPDDGQREPGNGHNCTMSMGLLPLTFYGGCPFNQGSSKGPRDLISGLVFRKIKNRPIDSGPLNKTWRQPEEPNPIEDILEEMRKAAENVENAYEALTEALKILGQGNTFTSAPFFMVDPCLTHPSHFSCEPAARP